MLVLEVPVYVLTEVHYSIRHLDLICSIIRQLLAQKQPLAECCTVLVNCTGF